MFGSQVFASVNSANPDQAVIMQSQLGKSAVGTGIAALGQKKSVTSPATDDPIRNVMINVPSSARETLPRVPETDEKKLERHARGNSDLKDILTTETQNRRAVQAVAAIQLEETPGTHRGTAEFQTLEDYSQTKNMMTLEQSSIIKRGTESVDSKKQGDLANDFPTMAALHGHAGVLDV